MDLSESSRTYLRMHGVAHLVGAGRVEDAKKQVLGFESWLLERATKNEWTEAMEDVSRVRNVSPEDNELRLLESAMRLSAGHVRREPPGVGRADARAADAVRGRDGAIVEGNFGVEGAGWGEGVVAVGAVSGR